MKSTQLIDEKKRLFFNYIMKKKNNDTRLK